MINVKKFAAGLVLLATGIIVYILREKMHLLPDKNQYV
ncbi:phosphoribosyl-ATP pyrophosphatase [Ectobacillus sp. JY-23]|nr:phosphoribosyl-ATP pyrophosphatase [Ectobacillus sp. JY-23]UOY93270.1 phosphoribosyl-ATP pyrophosphatase [Ectobacillus sp. JY-23]